MRGKGGLSGEEKREERPEALPAPPHPLTKCGFARALLRTNSEQGLFQELYLKLTAAAAKSLQSCPQPHRWQPTRFRRPWDSPGKNTGVGCHFLLQCMKEKIESEVIQLCPTPSDPMDCSLPGSSVHGFSRQEYWSGVPLPSLI